MKIRMGALLSLLALTAGCSTTGTETDAADEPLYMRMTDADVELADATVQRALETQLSGISLDWRNPASGHSGTVTPQRTYRTANGVYCRSYREELTVGQRTANYSDRACRNGDGLWIPL